MNMPLRDQDYTVPTQPMQMGTMQGWPASSRIAWGWSASGEFVGCRSALHAIYLSKWDLVYCLSPSPSARFKDSSSWMSGHYYRWTAEWLFQSRWRGERRKLSFITIRGMVSAVGGSLKNWEIPWPHMEDRHSYCKLCIYLSSLAVACLFPCTKWMWLLFQTLATIPFCWSVIT